MEQPIVSVILPVYNGAKFLRESIDSVLRQTMKEFELLIIDDNSEDDSLEVITSYKDSRIKVFRNKENRRTGYCLNFGVSMAKGSYIARMDQDDICVKQRFEKQVRFLESRPEISLCGGQIESFPRKNCKISNYPLNHEEICLRLLTTSPFAHPTVMFRSSLFEEYNYDENYIAEGMTLWTKVLLKHNGGNLPEVLLKYRIHESSVTKTFYKRIRKESLEIRKRYAKVLFQNVPNAYIDTLYLSSFPYFRKIAVRAILKSETTFDKELLSAALSDVENKVCRESIWNRISQKLRA